MRPEPTTPTPIAFRQPSCRYPAQHPAGDGKPSKDAVGRQWQMESSWLEKPAPSFISSHEPAVPPRPQRLKPTGCPPIERPTGVSAIAVYRYAADIAFRFGRFRHRDGQHAVLERGRGLVLLDVLQRYAAFEAAVVPLAEAAGLGLRFRVLLAGDRKNAVCDFEADVLFLESGQFGGDADLLVCLIDVDLGPAQPVLRPGARSERCEIEPAEYIVEHAVHFTMQRKKRMDVC